MKRSSYSRGAVEFTLLSFLLGCGTAVLLNAQNVIISESGTNVRILNSDLAVLALQEPKKDLPCSVTPVKPVLGFDLKFHAGYEVSIPRRELSGPDTLLTTIFRVIPEGREDQELYFVQRVQVPPIEPEAGGNVYLQGGFNLGEGRYHIDWLMRDRAERACSAYWNTEASVSAAERQTSLALPPGAVAALEDDVFGEEAAVDRSQVDPPLNVKVLIHFAPLDPRSTLLQPVDKSALVSILRGIFRDPRINKFSVVAFNLHEQRIIYRQDYSDRIDFARLGEALKSIDLGTIDIKRLAAKNPETEFVSELIQKEIGTADRPDALIFAGPRLTVTDSVPSQTLREVGDLEYPVFYLTYNLQPMANPWRDVIGRAVRFFRGSEYTITRPRDLLLALNEIVTRITRAGEARRAACSTPQSGLR